MGKRVSLHLNDSILRRAKFAAREANRPVEDILLEWLADYADNLPVETMSNDEIIRWCQYELNPVTALEIRRLLNAHHDAGLSLAESRRLDALLAQYRRDIIRKSRALAIADARGLEVVSGRSRGEMW